MQKDIIYVGLQGLFFIVILFDFLDVSLGINNIYSGIIIGLIGIVILILSLLQLNKNLSPFPTPLENGQLITTGLYSVVRHPIYFGILILFLGYSLYANSLFKLLVVLALAVLFHFKSEYEERLLVKKYPDYSNYQKKTAKIIPFIK